MLRSLLCKKTSKTDNQLTQDVESTDAFRMAFDWHFHLVQMHKSFQFC